MLILPTELAVEAGGPAREAAFLVVVDERGHLSRGLPIEIRSERGRLRAMRWLGPGIAVLSFSVELGAESIDLAVSLADETLAEAELSTVAGWPVSGELVAPPAEVERGVALDLAGSATSVDGHDLPASALRLRCGGTLIELPGTCPTETASSPLLVELVAMIDGIAVPLASSSVTLREAGEEEVESHAIRDAPLPPDARTPSHGRLAGFIRPGADIWARFVGAIGARVELPVGVEWLRLSASAEYALNPFSATGQAGVDDELDALRHQVGASVGGVIVFDGDLGGVIRGEVALAYGRLDVSLRDADGSADELALEGRVAGGPRLRVDDLELGADAVVAVGGPVSSPTWPAALVRISLEVSVAALAP